MGQLTKPFPSPCILGIVTADMLAARRYPERLWECGGVELRADGVPADEISAAIRDFQAEKVRREFTGPVVFTLRLQRDLGAWEDARAGEREAVWRALPVGACTYADIEIEEIDRLDPGTIHALRDTGAGILLSHHGFEIRDQSPERWEALLAEMRKHSPDGVKFAVLVASKQVPAVLELARKVAAEFPVSCILGMGKGGEITRLVSPLLGCPLTYGYLGADPLAPGQLPAETMRRFFERARTEGLPPGDGSEAAWMEWAAGLWARVERDA